MARNPFDQFDGQAKADRNAFDQFGGSIDYRKPSAMDAFLSGTGDALSFGFGDELQGLVQGFGGALEGKDFWNTYNNSVDEARQWQGLSEYVDPLAFGAGQIAGSIVPGFAAGGIARGVMGAARFADMGRKAGLLSRIGAAGAAGAAGGGLYGAGSADGEDVGQSALEGAMWGAPAGALGQAVLGEFLPHVAKGVVNQFSPEKRAIGALSDTLERFGQTPAQLEAAIKAANAPGAPAGAMAVDVIKGAPQVLKGAAVRPSAGREAIRETFDARNNEIANETAQDVWDTLGNGIPRDAAARVRSLSDIQETAAKPLYAQVYQTPVQQVPKAAKDFIEFNSRQGARFRSAIEEARESMRRKLGPNVTDDQLMRYPEFWHTALHNVEERVGRAISGAKMDPLGAPTGKAIAEMTGDARKFNDEVRNMLGDKFKQAQDIYAGAAKSKSAEEFGMDMVKASGDLDLGEVAARLAKMTPAERQHAQYGALSALEELLRKADTGSGRVNPLRAIIGNKSKRRTLQHIFGQSQGFDDLMARMESRQKMFNTTVESGVGVNSQTAPLLAAQSSFEAVTNPTAGGIKGMLLKILGQDAADKYSESVSNKLIDLMKMPTQDLEAAITRAGGFQKWLRQEGLLQAALKRAQSLPEDRARALTGALVGNLWGVNAGQGAASAGGM